jgi:ssDNA-binding Zn-finger/Zn-ribbon topoisomerase 1
MKKDKFIPYQKCPVCEGTKRVWINQWEPNTVTMASGWQSCDVCGGAGIILMFKVEKEKEK